MLLGYTTSDYNKHCIKFAYGFSSPSIVFPAQLNNGQDVLVDDYYQSYMWMKANTPQDARFLAWWDYGYQITGIGNRTTLADGNTWNHEHIALIGKIMMSSVEKAHSLARHMADYVLIWTGSNGDIGKSIHMARIGNSVYPDVCPNDPQCSNFMFRDNSRTPPKMLRQSFLYNMHEHGVGGVELNQSLFREVYRSKYNLVRIFEVLNVSKKSKRWIADPANRVCYPPGSWSCSGQYPPAKPIQDMLATAVKLR
ncbi:unnamed protein product [Phytomonas sp. Hart1]|nr:unnamed protein product [Phytomonas sp. Hart1]|eukprot:CCW71933.1 unnamed protein product [Phytomonas sp. isolate Hart1]